MPLIAGSHRPVPNAFDDHARRAPDRIAIVDPTRSWTYGEVARIANQIARWLAARGIGPGQRVAIHAQRNAWTPIAMLGVLKSGAAFVLLDAEYPRERILAHMAVGKPTAWIETASSAAPEWLSGVDHVLVCGTEATDLSALPDSPPDIPLAADAMAYAVFTSGTTGVPKAAPATHAGLAHFVEWQSATFGLTATDRFAALSGLAHAPFIRDVCVPLAIGATIVVPAQELRREPDALATWLAEQRISVANLTPSLGRVLAHARGGVARDLRVAFFVGEPLVSAVVDGLRHLMPAATFVNLFGASETCQAVSAYVVPDGITGPVPIGRGIDRTQLLLLDDAGKLAIGGEEGEIIVRSPYLATAYLTGERGGYGTNPFTRDPDDRVYRTGDRGRYLPDGSVEHLGRRDLQVKVRGFRVELGDVERAMLHQPGVQHAVAALGADDASLAAFVVGTMEPTALAAALRDRLPDYMVPSTIVRVAALPMTPNGKVDRGALVSAAPDATAAANGIAAPTDDAIDDLERTIAGVWREVLGVKFVGRHDNFFDLGGHSLNAIRVIVLMSEALGTEVAVRAIFDTPTVAELAARLRTQGKAKPTAAPPTRISYRRSRATSARATPGQETFYYLDRDTHDPASYYVPIASTINGDLDEKLLAECYRQLVAHHSVYRTAYREIDGVLHQFVTPRKDARVDELEIVEIADVPPDRRPEAIDRAAAELVARDYDLALGHGVIRSRLLRFAPDRHAIVTIVNHVASDAGSVLSFSKQLFDGYARLRDGAQRALPNDPPLQYIDFAHARQQWSESPAGKAHRELWSARLRDAPPVALDGDFPRGPLDARRDAAPLGITANPCHPPEYVPLPAHVYEAVVAAARSARTTPYVVFMSGLVWLLRTQSGQTDITIQTSYTHRGEDAALEQILGSLTRFTVVRADIARCTSLSETIDRVKVAVEEMFESGPPYDPYREVPHTLRRMFLNYIPMQRAGDSSHVGNLVVTPHGFPFPPFKRAWDLHLQVIDDSKSARLFWIGCEQLFRRTTLLALSERYLGILAGLVTAEPVSPP